MLLGIRNVDVIDPQGLQFAILAIPWFSHIYIVDKVSLIMKITATLINI